jgi:hypothetical protein
VDGAGHFATAGWGLSQLLEILMKRIIAVILVLLAGCIGDAELPIVSSTPIPGTQFEVHLGGPDAKGDFGYYVTSSSGINSGYRSLGPLKPNQTTPATLENQGNGVFRIQWGDPSGLQYAIIDISNKRFVEDSNPVNSRNEPFSPPLERRSP